MEGEHQWRLKTGWIMRSNARTLPRLKQPCCSEPHLLLALMAGTLGTKTTARGVELPPQSDELSNNTTLPSFSNSVLAADISAMSSNHMPIVSLAEGVHIGMRLATSAVRLSLSHRRVRLTFIAFKNFAHAIETSFSACCCFRRDV